VVAVIREPAPARQVVLLDLDGTLSESEPGILGSLKQALIRLGIEVACDDVLRSAIGPSWAPGMPDLGVPKERVAELIAAYREVYEVTGLFETALYDGVAEMLDALDDLGCSLCVATSKPERSARRVIEHLGLSERFKVVGGADEDVNRVEKADVIAHVLDQLGLVGGPELVMVGDRRYDVEGAAAHGIDTIGATWGYGTVEELRMAGAWAIAGTPAEVATLIAGQSPASRSESRHS
jgi:phosphoglycolate phosphatase